MTKWQEVRLGDVCDVKGGKRLPKGVNLVTMKNAHPYIRVRDLGQGKRLQLNQNYEYVDDETQKIISHYIVSEDDVLISIVGTIGLIGIVGNSLNNANLTENCVKLINLRGIDKDFLYYFLISNSGQDAIKQRTVGAVQAKLPIKNIQTIQILLPPLDIQKKIAGVLGALDDKIELNNRINNNLEQQAQALFKSWFVDKEYEVERDTTLGVICKCELGGTPSRVKPEYWNGNIAWINSGEVNKFRIIKASEYITEIGLKHSATKLFPRKTTVLAITGATLGQISLLEIDSCTNQSVVGILENETLPYEFIYPYICYNIKELLSHQTGGAQQHINKQNVEQLALSLPKATLIKEYKNIVAPIFELIAKNCFESERLSALRDTLLPRLMSGEVDVSNVDISELSSADKSSFTEETK